MSAGARPPTAEGRLDKTPLVHLLVDLADRGLTGSVVLASPRPTGTEDNVVYFREGAPAKVRTGQPVARLGEILVEFGFLTEPARRATLQAAMKAAELHGQLLVRTGVIDHKVLLTSLRTQAGRKMSHIFGVPPETTYSFFEGADLLDRWGGPELIVLDPLEQIWRAACARSNEQVIDSSLARLGITTLKLHGATVVGRFGFGPAELRLVARMRESPSTLADLVASGVATERATRLVVYVLLVTRHLDLGQSAGPVGIGVAKPPVAKVAPAPQRTGPPATASAPIAQVAPAAELPALTAQLAARRTDILKRAETIDTEDYFQMLGVARDAPDPAIQTAYFGLAKVWHTDRLPRELADVRDAAAKVFARIDEAFQTLRSPDRRTRYVQTLDLSGNAETEQEQVEKILEAATLFQHAEVFFKQRDLAKAEQSIARAHELDPEQGDYMALLAAVQLQTRGANAPVDDLVALLDGAISRNDKCERAYFYRGNLRKRIGQIDLAMDDYRIAFQLNPNNLDAGRELRVHDMRQAKQSGLPDKSKHPSKNPSTPAAKKTAPPKKAEGVFSGIEKLFKR